MPHSLFTSSVSRSWPFWRALIYWLVGGRGFGLFLWLVGIPSWKSWELSCVDRSLWVFFVLMLFIFYVFGRGRSSLRRGLVSSCEERGCCLVVGRGALSAVDCGAVPLAERRLREPGSWARARPRHLWLRAQWDRGMASGSQRRSLCCLDVAPGLWGSTVRGFLSPRRTLPMSADMPPAPAPGALNRVFSPSIFRLTVKKTCLQMTGSQSERPASSA